jgi:hypothetical protein
VFIWWLSISEEERELIRKEYSSLLKGSLSTQSFKVLKYDQVEEGLKLAVSNTLEGKVTLIPN